jgi:hypothetical protein
MSSQFFKDLSKLTDDREDPKSALKNMFLWVLDGDQDEDYQFYLSVCIDDNGCDITRDGAKKLTYNEWLNQ